MTAVYEDNASRWERNPDGSFRHLPKQKTARRGVPTHDHAQSVTAYWDYDTSLTPPPNVGWVITDDDVFENVTTVTFSDQTSRGVDVSGWLREIDADDIIAFQDADDVSNNGRFLVTGPSVDGVDWWSIPVTPLNINGTGVAKNEEVLVRLTFDEGQGGAGLSVQDVTAIARAEVAGAGHADEAHVHDYSPTGHDHDGTYAPASHAHTDFSGAQAYIEHVTATSGISGNTNPNAVAASFTENGVSGEYADAGNGIEVPWTGLYIVSVSHRGGGSGGDRGYWTLAIHVDGTAVSSYNQPIRALGDNTLITTLTATIWLTAFSVVGIRYFRPTAASGNLNIYEAITRVTFVGAPITSP